MRSTGRRPAFALTHLDSRRHSPYLGVASPVCLTRTHGSSGGWLALDAAADLTYHRRMTMKAPIVETEVQEASVFWAATCMFRGFSDPSRLAIVQHLALGEHRVVDLTQHLGLAQSTVSKHLACLKDCGLVTSRPEGRASMWSLSHREAVMDLLAAAERVLALTGDAVVLCPRYGSEASPEGR